MKCPYGFSGLLPSERVPYNNNRTPKFMQIVIDPMLYNEARFEMVDAPSVAAAVAVISQPG
jgi:hypothetical protein